MLGRGEMKLSFAAFFPQGLSVAKERRSPRFAGSVLLGRPAVLRRFLYVDAAARPDSRTNCRGLLAAEGMNR
jgi:hypothetical protein